MLTARDVSVRAVLFNICFAVAIVALTYVDAFALHSGGVPVLILTCGLVAAIVSRSGAMGLAGLFVGGVVLNVAATLPSNQLNLSVALVTLASGAGVGFVIRLWVPQLELRAAGDPVIVSVVTLLMTSPVAVVLGLQGAALTPVALFSAWAAATAGTLVLLLPVLCFKRGRPVRHLREFVVLALAVGAAVVFVAGPGAMDIGLGLAALILLPMMVFAGMRYGVLAAVGVVSAAEIITAVIRVSTDQVPATGELLQSQLAGILLLVVSVTVLLILRSQRDALHAAHASQQIATAFLKHADPMWYVKVPESPGALKYYALGGNAFRARDDLVGTGDETVFGEQAAAEIADRDLEVVRTGEARVDREQLPLPDGTTRTFVSNRFPIRDEVGTVVGLGGVRTDITESKHQAEVVAQQARVLEATFDSAPVPIMRVHAEEGFRITAANSALALVSGRSREELVGLGLKDLVADSDWAVLQSVFRRAGADRRRTRWNPQAEVSIPVGSGPDRQVLMTLAQVRTSETSDSPTQRDGQFIVHVEDVTARRAAEDAVKRNSIFDLTTGLLNRVALDDRLDAWLYRVDGEGPGVTLITCDIDDFKSINDAYGHPLGDEVLAQIGERISSAAPQGSVIARLGADEFAVLVRSDSAEDVGLVVGALRQALSAPVGESGSEVAITMCFGVATVSEPDLTAVEMMRRAQLALFRAKGEGRSQVAFYADSMRRQVQETINVRKELSHAVAQRSFAAFYQPIVDLADGSVLSYEALVRLPSREGNILTPDMFLDIARQAGLIGVIDDLILEQSLENLASGALKVPTAHVSVNCEAEDLKDPDYALRVISALHKHGVDPTSLTVEVTESALLQIGDEVLANVVSLRSVGVKLAVDDFGTGYSSLSQIRNLKADILKIDRSFVSAMIGDDEAANIVETIISLAHGLDMIVIAEGIETREQAEKLRRLGCDRGQGYLFGRPTPVAEPVRPSTEADISQVPLQREHIDLPRVTD